MVIDVFGFHIKFDMTEPTATARYISVLKYQPPWEYDIQE